MAQNKMMPSQLMGGRPQDMIKKPSQKVKPAAGKKDGSKSPAVKKPKEIQYIKLLVFQQHFKGHELKSFDEQENEEEQP